MSGVLSALQAIAWSLGIWLAVSVVSAAVLAVWFRRRARANELLSAEARRRDFVEAATAEDTTTQ